ncbi:MAG: hypothetical protein LLG44_00135 [Chloroflexi bacterium]|nr:hypothetical protein [Chloroflexota bacterium]
MWNEVVLLASGLACGWSLVNLLAAPREQVRGIWVRLLLGAAAGLGMVIWLAVSSLSSGLAGLIIVAGTALIAYAANAKQVNRQPIVFPPHQPNVAADAAGSAVLLVTVAEPSQYNGPAYWSQALLLEDKVPHWMTRPRAYAHIRQAYALMGDSFPLDAELAALTHRLSATLPEVHIDYA